MEITVEKFHQVMSYQTRALIIKMYLSTFAKPVYTGSEAGAMIKNLELESRLDELNKEMNEFAQSLSEEELRALEELSMSLKTNPEVKEKYLYKNEQIKKDIHDELHLNMNMEEYIDYIERNQD